MTDPNIIHSFCAALGIHRSVRSFEDKPIPENLLRQVLQAESKPSVANKRGQEIMIHRETWQRYAGRDPLQRLPGMREIQYRFGLHYKAESEPSP